MTLILKIVFWSAVSLSLYVYIVYPIILFLLSSLVQTHRDLKYIFRRGERRRDRKPIDLPEVTLGFSAHNEEDVIEEKLENCLALNYPDGKLDIIVASDGSDDKTDEIVRRFAGRGVKLIADGNRRGKAARINQIVDEADTPVVVLSDANTMYDPDAVRTLVRHFAEENVGAVCGELRMTGPDGQLESESIYWRYEVMLKFMENKLNLVLGSNGGIYAIRRELFEPISEDTIVEDFVIPLILRSKGYRIVYDPEAVANEETTGSVESEVSRRKRIGAGNWQAAVMLRSMLNPLNGTMAFSFWSHKLLRWTVPLAMVLALVTNLILVGEMTYTVLMGAQTVFYLAALIGMAGPGGPLGRVCSLPYALVSMNAGLLCGLIRFLGGKQDVAWERTGRTQPPAAPSQEEPDEAPRQEDVPPDDGWKPVEPAGPIVENEHEQPPAAGNDEETKEFPPVDSPGDTDDTSDGR